jgi:hypothetical protein
LKQAQAVAWYTWQWWDDVDQELFKAQHQPQQHGDVTEPWPIGRLRHPLSFKGTGTFISPLAAFYVIDDQVNAGETARIKVEGNLCLLLQHWWVFGIAAGAVEFSTGHVADLNP